MALRFNKIVKQQINPGLYRPNRLDAIVDKRLSYSDNNRYELTFGNDTDNNIPMYYSETRSQSIIDKANDYYFVVERIRIPNNLPLFLFEDGEYQISLIDQRVAPPAITTVTLTNVPVNINNPADPGVYSLFQFGTIFNVGMANLFTAAGVPGITFELRHTDRFTFEYYYDTGIYAIDPFNEVGSPPSDLINPTQDFLIEFSPKLKRLLPAFTYTFQDPQGPFGRGYRLCFLGEVTGTLVAGIQQKILSQEVPTFTSFITQGRIVVTSSRLPVAKVNISGPDNKQTPSVIDFLLNPSNDLSTVYQPLFYSSDQPRLIDLYGDSPVVALDFGFYFEDINKNLIPLDLEPGQYVDMKINFVHKSLENNAYTS